MFISLKYEIKECAEHNIFIKHDINNWRILWVLAYVPSGRLAGCPIVLKIFLPYEYPFEPPIVHLLTKTGLSNFHIGDFYLTYYDITDPRAHSNSCIDMLYPRSNSLSTWNYKINLVGMILSFIAGLTSYYLQQVNSEAYNHQYISVESLHYLRKEAYTTYEKYQDNLPSLIPLDNTKGYIIKTESITFSDSQIISGPNKVFISEPFDLTTTKSAHFIIPKKIPENIVITFIITNDPNDIKSEKHDTSSVQYGITGVNALKSKDNKQIWSMFGQPLFMSEQDVCITINQGEFTVACKTEQKYWKINGDMPVCNPTRIFGKEDIPLYLVVVFNSKKGPTCTIKINTKATTGVVYKSDYNNEEYKEEETEEETEEEKEKREKKNKKLIEYQKEQNIKNLKLFLDNYYFVINFCVNSDKKKLINRLLIDFNNYKRKSIIPNYKDDMGQIKKLLYLLGLNYEFEIDDNAKTITFFKCSIKKINSSKIEIDLKNNIVTFELNNKINEIDEIDEIDKIDEINEIVKIDEDTIIVSIIFSFRKRLYFDKKIKQY
jgi:ubiquitin-protein ligase